MGWEIIIAAVLASMVTRSWERSRRRSKAEWEEARREAREHAERRIADRVERLHRRRERIEVARRSGPADPMWWAWGTGWLLAGAGRASVAAAAGAREGAAVGAREGYRIGRERARARRERRGRRGRVDTAGGPHPPREEQQRPREEPREEPRVALVACVDCGIYSAVDADGRCRGCAARAAAPRTSDDRDTEPGDGDPDVTGPDVAGAEVADSTDEGEDQEGTNTMTESTTGRAINMNGSNLSGGDGEGYASTIALLTQVGQLLDHVDGVMNDLGDTIASKHVDTITIQGVSDVEDNLQAATNRCGELLKHVQAKHEEVAVAVVGAGGSAEVADTDWYDNY